MTKGEKDMKMILNDDEYRVLTLFRALPPEKREEFLNFQRALNRGDMETCRRFCERWNASDVFNAFLARSMA